MVTKISIYLPKALIKVLLILEVSRRTGALLVSPSKNEWTSSSTWSHWSSTHNINLSTIAPSLLSRISPISTKNQDHYKHTLLRQISRPLGSPCCCQATLGPFSVASSVSPLCWFGSALLGYFVEKRILPESGIFVTLVASSLTVSRPTPVLNELCWGTFLPASLALLLLSLKENKSQRQDTNSTIDGAFHDNDDYTILKSIQRLAIPFLLASVGSILGCGVSFWICNAWHSVAPSWLLAPPDARIALSCLVASFIGGSVNFFATASAIAAASSASATATIVSSMAASDIVVMAIYFAFIGVAVSSDGFKRLFNRNRAVLGSEGEYDRVPLPKLPVTDASPTNSKTAEEEEESKQKLTLSKGRAIRAGLLASSLAWTMVRFATWTERRLDGFVPGLACAVIAGCTPLIKQVLRGWSSVQQHWYSDMKRVASPLSQVSFLLLFSSIGSTADLKQAAQSGLACLVVSLIALVIHFVVTLVGSVWVSCRQNTATIRSSSVWRDIDLEDVLVASNAAIGGPATAAAFCGRIKSRPVEGIAYAGTFWGVVGYAIGTTIGVLTYRVLGWNLLHGGS